MDVDRKACAKAWHTYLATLPAEHPHRAHKPTAFGFGGTPELADELAALVLSGHKRATTSLPIEYTTFKQPLPKAGDLSIITRGDGIPCAIIERISVTTIPFAEVDAEYAAVEGEGDGSLGFWRAAHERYFSSTSARLGGHFDAQSLVQCEIFKVVWRAAAQHDSSDTIAGE
jgi:uncharacterized protein YhfF